jgi:hypothetical protein
MNRLSWLMPGRADLLTPSVMLLVAANLLPLYGVCFLGWEVFPVLLLFWVENVIVGVLNVFKMLVASPSRPTGWLVKVFMIPFFCFHYGMFTLVHGIFVFGLFGGYFTSGAGFPDEASLLGAIGNFRLGWAILALFLSHAASFAINYLGKGEYRQASLKDLMQQPYGRVVLLHVTIVIGGFLVTLLGSPVFALVLLVLLKGTIDVQVHIREHKRYAGKKYPATPNNLPMSGESGA